MRRVMPRVSACLALTGTVAALLSAATGLATLTEVATAAPAAAAAPAAPAVAAADPQPTPVALDNLDLVPVTTWGVSGLNSAATQTSTLDVLVWDFAQVGGRMFVAGGFLTVQQDKTATPIPQPYIAAFDVNTGAWISTWRPTLDRVAYSLAVYGGKLIVGGEFETVNGRPRTGLVALDPLTGAIDDSFAGAVERPWSTARAMVRDLDVENGALYVAGNFSHLVGAAATRITAYKAGRFTSPSGTVDATWKPAVTGSSVWGIDADAATHQVNLAGFFTAVNGLAGSGYFHTVDDATGASVPGMKAIPRNLPGSQPEFFDATVGNGLVFAVGEQHILQVLSPGDHTMLGYHHTGYGNAAFAYKGSFAGGAFQVGVRIGSVVFAGCHCTYSERNGYVNHFSSYTNRFTPHRLVMAYDATTGGLIENFLPDINSPRDGTWAVTSDTNGCLYVGGDFHVGGVDHGRARWLGGFAKLCPKGFDPAAQPQVGADRYLSAGASWSYSDAGTDLGTAWREPGFDDAAWRKGPAPLGFGSAEKTTLAAGHTTYYARTRFELNGTLPPSLAVKLKADDGAVVYLNGTEILRDNLPAGTVTTETPASTWRGGEAENFTVHTVPASALVKGTNVLAVEVHNVWSGNSDLAFDLDVASSDQVIPGAAQPSASASASATASAAPSAAPSPSGAPAVDGLVPLGSTWTHTDSGAGEPAGWTSGIVGGATGQAQFGFGDGDEKTPLTPGRTTYYFTRSFTVADPAAHAGGLTLSLAADDGAVVYLNGIELTRVNMPAGPVGPETKSTTWVDAGDEKVKTYSVPATALRAGTNVVAAEVHQVYAGNSDLSFDLGLG